ncbi:MSH3 (predicted) [Pycnogonum litorale]
MQYLIEVKNSGMKFVPEDWIMISATKYVKRFRSPHVQNLINEISKQNEILDENCKEAWISFLRSFSNSYLKYKKAITKLATLDCLLSFCEVAKKYNLCKPSYTDHFIQLKINNGRNPIISASMDYPTQFVSNSTELQHNGNICQIITGPNMGGKSSYIRQVALICILGQIGSFVPCDFAVLPVLDAVYARIGASDNIYEKESTFLSEVRDVSDIMKQATSNSLIIIDEFGRGTSTYDGSALAYATLLYLIKEVQCFTLFVTHYPVVTELENVLQNRCQNVHMSYLLQKGKKSHRYWVIPRKI